MTEAEWRDIPGFEGLYRVSNTGLVRSLGRAIMGVRSGKVTMIRYKPKLLITTHYSDRRIRRVVMLYRADGTHTDKVYVIDLVRQAFGNDVANALPAVFQKYPNTRKAA